MNEADRQELERLRDEVEWLRQEVFMCHEHLSQIGIGKPHWSLPGRLHLLQEPASSEPPGAFESRIAQLVKIVQSLVRVCDRDGVKDTGELTRAKDMLAHKAEAWGIPL